MGYICCGVGACRRLMVLADQCKVGAELGALIACRCLGYLSERFRLLPVVALGLPEHSMIRVFVYVLLSRLLFLRERKIRSYLC